MKRKGWIVPKIMLCSINGWPDVQALKNGRFVMLEMKSPGKKLDPLQRYVHQLIKKEKGEVYKVDTWEQYLKLKL